MLYKAAPDETWDLNLSAQLLESDGRVTRMGWSDLCVASKIHQTRPLVAVRGYVYASVFLARGHTVCSWQGLRLAPHANLGMRSRVAAAFVPSSAEAPALVAMDGVIEARGRPTLQEVRLFSVAPDGDLRLLDATEATTEEVAQFVWHPSGRFLYVSLQEYVRDQGHYVGSTLGVYSVDAGGRLTSIESRDEAGGFVFPSLSDRPPVMTVSTRAGIPRH